MKKSIGSNNIFFHILKKVLVKFKNAGFGIGLIKNFPKVSDYFNDRNVSFLGKCKVLFSFIATLIYFVFSIDIIPEVLFGPLGFLDDAFMIIWAIGIINEELAKYKGPKDNSIRGNKKVYKDPNIIDDAVYSIKDDE